MSMKLGILSIATSVAIMAAASASALSVNLVNSSAQGAGNQASVFAPNHTNYITGGASWLGGIDPTWTGPDQANISKSPFEDGSGNPYSGQSYFSVIADNFNTSIGGGAQGSATLTFGKTQTGLNMLWGSIDSYNTIEFFLDGSSLGSLTGTNIVSDFGLGGTSDNFEQVALLRFGGFESGFDRVTFSSTGNSFEFALAPVPLPAAGLLLLTALGGMKVMSRRRKREDA